MTTENEINKEKHQLATSEVWKKIKQHELDAIVKLSGGVSEPLIIKGMLRVINDIEHWQ